MILPFLDAQGAYRVEPVPIPVSANSPLGAERLGGIRLLAAKTVAGYVYVSVGPHGDSVIAKPFVAVGGKAWALPLEGRAYGHVFAAINGKLAGDVVAEDDARGYVMSPAVWTPDPKLGWAKAKLTLLPSKEDGWVVGLSPQGEAWATSTKGLRRFDGKGWFERKIERFDLEGVDGRGRLWGNRYESLGEGFHRQDQQGGCYEGPRWEPLPRGFHLSAINAAGDATGYADGHAVRSVRGKLQILDTSEAFSSGRSIDAQGDVVGSIGDKATLWIDGRTIDLSDRMPDVDFSEGAAIDDQGVIALTGSRKGKPRLVLLVPR